MLGINILECVHLGCVVDMRLAVGRRRVAVSRRRVAVGRRLVADGYMSGTSSSGSSRLCCSLLERSSPAGSVSVSSQPESD